MVETLKFGTLKWYHIQNSTDDDMQFLQEEFYFHPLDIEDSQSSSSQRPKIDIYDNYYFLIFHYPQYDKSNKFLRVFETKIFWGSDYIITVGALHPEVKKMFDKAKETLQNPEIEDEEFMFGSSDQLLYQIMNTTIEMTYHLVKHFSRGIDNINSALFDSNAEKTIENISVARKNIILLNTIIVPQLRMFRKFESGQVEGFAENMEEYWGNLLDYMQKIDDMTEDYEELIENLSKTFDFLQANSSNEIIKILTFYSSILLPLTFVTGLFGMNVTLPLSNVNGAFYIIVGIMVLISISSIIFFKLKKWM